MLIFIWGALTDGYVGDEGGGGECAGGAARQLGEVAVGHEVLEGGGDADVVDPQEPAPGEALCQHPLVRGYEFDHLIC